jgi:pimeloyl-ACP methyl ester carboxylesterase
MPRPRSHDSIDATVASADGVPIRYHAEGRGEPALVFIHGWSCDRGHWTEQVTRFSADRQVITLDLGGHGESGRERQAWTVESLGADVRAVVLALDLRRVVLIGHSLGGPVAIEAAGHMPERVAAVIAVDALHDVDRKTDPAQVQALVDRWEKDFAGTAEKFVDFLLPQGCDPAIRQRLRAQFAAAPREIALALLRAQFDYDLPAALERVHVPIRAINTTLPSNVEAGRRHAADFAIADLSAQQLGHFPMLTAPTLFDQKLAETLRELGPVEAAPSPKRQSRFRAPGKDRPSGCQVSRPCGLVGRNSADASHTSIAASSRAPMPRRCRRRPDRHAA